MVPSRTSIALAQRTDAEGAFASLQQLIHKNLAVPISDEWSWMGSRAVVWKHSAHHVAQRRRNPEIIMMILLWTSFLKGPA